MFSSMLFKIFLKGKKKKKTLLPNLLKCLVVGELRCIVWFVTSAGDPAPASSYAPCWEPAGWGPKGPSCCCCPWPTAQGGWWDGLVSSHPRSRSHQRVRAGSTLKPEEAGFQLSPTGVCSMLMKKPPCWPHPQNIPKMLGSECSISARLLALVPSPGPSLVLWLV